MSGDGTITLTWGASDDRPASDVTIPRRVGHVRLIREIGRGGMGVVYLGDDELLQRRVAVKFLLSAVDEDDPGFRRFIEGARAVAETRHPGLTTTLSADVAEGVPYLVMEYIDGPSLSEVLRRRGALASEVALPVLARVCDAVAALHEAGIVHRDIKPGNILLDEKGHVFVTDFGLACPRRGKDGVGIAGTSVYMAAEAFDGAVTERSDVYALGVTAYETLTGRPPFSGDVAFLKELHATGTPDRAALESRGVPADVIEWVERSLHKKPFYRFKSAGRLARAIRECSAFPRETSGGAIAALLKHSPSGSATEGRPFEGDARSDYVNRLSQMAESRRLRDASLSSRPVSDAPTIVDGTLALDISCLTCGYSLKGLDIGSRCPECGVAALASLQPDRLIFADRQWALGVARGLRWISTSVAVAFLAIPLGALLLGLLVALFHLGQAAEVGELEAPSGVMVKIARGVFDMMGENMAGLTPIIRIVGWVLRLLVTAAFLFGSVMALRKAPGALVMRTLWLVRMAFLLLLFMMVTPLLTALLTMNSATSNDIGVISGIRGSTLLGVVAVTYCCVLSLYVCGLLRRTDERKRAKELFRLAVWVGGFLVFAGILFLLIELGVIGRLFEIMETALTLCVVVIAFSSIFMMMSMRRAATVILSAAEAHVSTSELPSALTAYWKSLDAGRATG